MSDLQFVVILPRRRVTTVADAEAAIVEACQAKTAILAALASLEPAPAALGEPERCGARPYPAGSEGDDGTECMLPAGHGWPHDDMPGYTEPDEAAPVASLPMCTEPAPANHPATCARLEGHRPPHRDLSNFEWGDVPPHHATASEPRCGAFLDDNGEGWICTAQLGHGGGEHVTYDLAGLVVHRWPVPADTIEQRKQDDADRRAAIARGIALGAAAPLAPRPALRVVAPVPPEVAAAACGTCAHPGAVHYLLSEHDHGCNQCEDQRHAATVVAQAIADGTPVIVDDDEDEGDEQAQAGAASLVGRLVEDAHDDSPVPTVGLVVGQVDDETLDVAWGAQRSAANPLTHHEPFDSLRPAREASQP